MQTISTSKKRRSVEVNGRTEYRYTKMVVSKAENGKKKNGKTAYISKTFHLLAD